MQAPRPWLGILGIVALACLPAPASAQAVGRSSAWTVTGPPTPTARVRISWTGNPAVSDASNVTFQIRPAAFEAGR